jgi:FkbM family methyltransferase
MESFEKEYEKIESAYYIENPFQQLIGRKETFSQSPLILYGCGILSNTIITLCQDNEIKVTALCDTYKTGIHHDTGLDIISPEKLKIDFPDANIIICSPKFADDIHRKLISLGYPETRIFKSTNSMVSFIHPVDFMNKHYAGYEWAYNFFADDTSKKLVLDRIKMYFTGAELSETSDAPAYFNPEIISLDADEVFIDGGAFNGDTAEIFIEQTKLVNGGGYRHIYSFEPDASAYEAAVRNLNKYKDVNVICKGLWSRDTELHFYSDGGNASSSFVIGNCSSSVQVTSIDSFFKDKYDEELPTFIKMDIEGAEKEALIGAEKAIRRKHPKLAICVYHKPQDIYELPKIIHEIDPGYRFYLQQCSEGFYDTVLYAV